MTEQEARELKVGDALFHIDSTGGTPAAGTFKGLHESIAGLEAIVDFHGWVGAFKPKKLARKLNEGSTSEPIPQGLTFRQYAAVHIFAAKAARGFYDDKEMKSGIKDTIFSVDLLLAKLEEPK